MLFLLKCSLRISRRSRRPSVFFFFRPPPGRVTLPVKGFYLSHPSEVELLHEVGEPSFFFFLIG